MDNDKLAERLLKADGIDPAGATKSERMAFGKMLDQQLKTKTSKPVFRPELWRIIMRSKMTKLAAAAVIVFAVLIGINPFGSPNVAFGDVLKNIQNAKTLSWKTTTIKEQASRNIRVMVREPHNMRIDFEDGKVWIIDFSKGKALMLDPSRKIATISPAETKALDLYNTFKNFQNMEGFLVEEVGKKQIDGKSSMGFRLIEKKKNHQIMVWADLETKLPIRMEQTFTETGSSPAFQKLIATDIVFDAVIDEALFRIEPPEEYKIDDSSGRTVQLASRVGSAANINRILKTCLNRVEKNGGKWPNSLHDLVNDGLDKEALINPSQPERTNGYVYLKPQKQVSPSDIILYEAYDVWSTGINVGFADGHVEFIKKESDFRKRLPE